jgi:hypothetical protein
MATISALENLHAPSSYDHSICQTRNINQENLALDALDC